VQELQEVTRKPGIKLKAVRVTAEAELDVCFGSKADIRGGLRDVRFTPESRHQLTHSIKKHSHASRTWHQLFDLDQTHERRVLMDFEMSAPGHGSQPPGQR
jgi:hypothetical protein